MSLKISVQSYYLNQCWIIVNSTLGNKLQWNFNHNSKFFIQEIAFKNVVCEMAVTVQMFRQYVSPSHQRILYWQLCTVCRYFSFMGKDFRSPCHIIVQKCYNQWFVTSGSNNSSSNSISRRNEHQWTPEKSLVKNAWWRHEMEAFSALLALCAGNSPATGDFPAQRAVTRSFNFFLDLNKRLSKQSWGW